MKKLFIIALLSITSLPLQAGSKLGTVGAQFLKMGAGARPTGMGEAFVGVADDVNAIYYNPAGLGFISRPEFEAMHTQWFEDTNYDFGAFVYPTDFGAFGVSAATLKVQDIEKRGLTENLQGKFESADEAYALSFAKVWGPQTSLGLTTRYIKQKLDTESASAWSGDVGLLRKMSSQPMSLGFAIRHLGQKIKFRNQAAPLPLVVDVGLSRSFFRDKLLVSIHSKKPNDNAVQYGLGSEVRLPLGQAMQMIGRLGYNSSITDGEDASGLSIGGGLAFNRLSLDVAWVPLGVLGDSFRYSLQMKF